MQRLTITTAKKIAETNIDAMKYPESPRFSMTAASATHASEPPPTRRQIRFAPQISAPGTVKAQCRDFLALEDQAQDKASFGK